AADRLQDLATVLAWARSLPDVREVNLIGEGRSGPLALLARPALEGLARTAINLHELDYGDGTGPVEPGIDLPGVLQFGALRSAAALTAPAPLRIYRAGPAFDASWPERSYALANAPGLLLIDRGRADARAIAAWIDGEGE